MNKRTNKPSSARAIEWPGYNKADLESQSTMLNDIAIVSVRDFSSCILSYKVLFFISTVSVQYKHV